MVLKNLYVITILPSYFEKSLCDHYITIIFWKISMWSQYYHHILATGKLGSVDSNKTQLEGTMLTTSMWDNVLRSSSISLDRYNSKIRKVSGCRPAVSSETILATRQEFILTKVTPVQNGSYFFEHLYFSEYDIRM